MFRAALSSSARGLRPCLCPVRDGLVSVGCIVAALRVALRVARRASSPDVYLRAHGEEVSQDPRGPLSGSPDERSVPRRLCRVRRCRGEAAFSAAFSASGVTVRRLRPPCSPPPRRPGNRARRPRPRCPFRLEGASPTTIPTCGRLRRRCRGCRRRTCRAGWPDRANLPTVPIWRCRASLPLRRLGTVLGMPSIGPAMSTYTATCASVHRFLAGRPLRDGRLHPVEKITNQLVAVRVRQKRHGNLMNRDERLHRVFESREISVALFERVGGQSPVERRGVDHVGCRSQPRRATTMTFSHTKYPGTNQSTASRPVTARA